MSTTLTTIHIAGINTSADVAAVTRELRTIQHANRLTVRLFDEGGGVVSILSNKDLAQADLEAAVTRAGFTADKIVTVDNALAAQMSEQAPARQASRNLALSEMSDIEL